MINRENTPKHLFAIPELDFSGDIFTDHVTGQWFRLGAWTITPNRDERDVEDVVSRQTLLIAPGEFRTLFKKLESIGNVIYEMGNPKGVVLDDGKKKEYRYDPFHRFVFPFSSVIGEPLVFIHHFAESDQFIINPDLWLFFELEEKIPGTGIWWDPCRGVDAIIHRVIDQGNLKVVDLRTDYLIKYLQARQMSLLICRYRHLHLFNPSQNMIASFVKEDVTLGSPEQSTKAVFQNCGLREGIPGLDSFLQRKLHLWVEIKPKKIDVKNPWVEKPTFDPYTFTLPTHVGPVAPARWRIFQKIKGRSFEGQNCDFMDRVYFRQEVLTKYEGASGFDVNDNGGVSCYNYWGLVRSTSRLGNELIATAIGDFAEGVPFEEWHHWKQYAVEPPSPETANTLDQEKKIADAVNSLVHSLGLLNDAFRSASSYFNIEIKDPLWHGSLDSIAGRQLKWVYPTSSDDDEFLKRATLTSTFVIEEIDAKSLRNLLKSIGEGLHQKNGKSLGSRNLLQRLTLIAMLIETISPNISKIPKLVNLAESKTANKDLEIELKNIYERIRKEFSPLACLYDLRTYGGIAHSPNKDKIAKAVKKIGLPERNWHRSDYLRLLDLVTGSVLKAQGHLENLHVHRQRKCHRFGSCGCRGFVKS